MAARMVARALMAASLIITPLCQPLRLYSAPRTIVRLKHCEREKISSVDLAPEQGEQGGEKARDNQLENPAN